MLLGLFVLVTSPSFHVQCSPQPHLNIVSLTVLPVDLVLVSRVLGIGSSHRHKEFLVLLEIIPRSLLIPPASATIEGRVRSSWEFSHRLRSALSARTNIGHDGQF